MISLDGLFRKFISLRIVRRFIPIFFYYYNKPEDILKEIFIPLEDAVVELKRRKNDAMLQIKIAKYLENDIPHHFLKEGGIFYLSRFLATPNHELLHVHNLSKKYPLPLVVGQDTKSKFTPNNELKLALAKLPVVKGLSHNKDEIIEYFTLIDFHKFQGKRFNTINLRFGENIVEFHNKLFNELSITNVEIADETHWVDRNHRDNIFMQYKHTLALLCTHGIMFESYPSCEYDFLRTVVYPAFKEIEKKFGVKPLIVEHITNEQEITRNWNSYPSVLYQLIKRKFDNKTLS